MGIDSVIDTQNYFLTFVKFLRVLEIGRPSLIGKLTGTDSLYSMVVQDLSNIRHELVVPIRRHTS